MFRSLLIAAITTAALAGGAQADPMKPVTFTVTLKGVSTPGTLKLSDGTTAPAPVSPVVYVLHRGKNPLFTDGQVDAGLGLEALAEDGNPMMLAESMRKNPMAALVGVVDTPVGDTAAGPLLPGKTFTFTVQAMPGMALSLATMFGQSNDLFYAPGRDGIALFDKHGKPLTGAIGTKLVLWDAGTEVNQEPGLGADQGPRQKAPNTGMAEHGKVRRVKDAFTYPPVGQVVEVTVTASADMAGR
jgi:hypothetical protein